MAKIIKPCPFCGKDFNDKKDKYVHLEKWGCPKAYKEITKITAPKCACGCGEKVETNKRNPRKFNKYIRGHNKRKTNVRIEEEK